MSLYQSDIDTSSMLELNSKAGLFPNSDIYTSGMVLFICQHSLGAI